MKDYQPIDCRTYGEFERAIMARQRLRIRWRDADDLEHLEIVLPTDLETCRGEEFLHVGNEQGQSFRLRLDRIISADSWPVVARRR